MNGWRKMERFDCLFIHHFSPRISVMQFLLLIVDIL